MARDLDEELGDDGDGDGESEADGEVDAPGGSKERGWSTARAAVTMQAAPKPRTNLLLPVHNLLIQNLLLLTHLASKLASLLAY